LTTDEGSSRRPVWTPDGATIAYATNEEGNFDIRELPSDGRSAGAFEVLLDLERRVPEVVFTPDGQGVIFRVGTTGSADIGFLDLATGEVNDSLLATEFDEWGIALSPDGRWLAYSSNATGEQEVLVRPFPDVHSGMTTVSRGGGSEPVWARSGAELFYRSGDGWMTVATYSADSVFNVQSWERLFDARPFRATPSGRDYDVAPSGDRFLMVLRESSDTQRGERARTRMIEILNWFTELEELVRR
jgi:serine/threonine-protein kinase